ncbi:MAG: FHA domain-containing protein [Microbacterium sp.]|uniref:FHA domain-containing protein n=1 Tax=Microbacterium sp. TaxID=51671 RepID=UPI00260335AF|nr:FHA domain-containing protein [Microbacterium sp.]MCX6502041.1 FHA domain-containing protein [Microbacterium sp.]
MTERVWLDGALPAVATDTWAVMSAGRGAIPAARRILALPADTAAPAALLDVLLADGLAATPAFAVVALEDDRLTAFLRGPFVLRAERTDGTIDRVDGFGVHSWREVTMTDIRRVWCLQSPAITRTDSAPRALPARPGPTTASGIAMRATAAVTAGPDAALAPPRPALPVDAAPRMIELPTGERIAIEGDLLIGRGPRSDRLDGRDLPTLIALDRAPREVSRRHVRVSRRGADVRIEDLGSAGGTSLVDAAGTARRLRPSEPAPVAVGETAELPGGVRIRFVGDA